MEQIIIEVDENTARKWRESSSEIKRGIANNFKILFDKIVGETKVAQFETLLDKASNEAERNGLTEEILQKLLNEG